MGSYSAVRRPYIGKGDLEDEATRFLHEYYPLALDFPLPVPILQIASDMGLTIITHERLSEDFSILGQMYFCDCDADIYRDEGQEYVALPVSAGTMLIDPYTKLEANIGCFNNTVAHETFHWYRHRNYFMGLIRNGNRSVYATRCNREQVNGRSRGTLKTDIDWIEWQATNIAPRILMPHQTIEQVVRKSIQESRQYYCSAKAVLNQAITDVMERYRVSYASACIRFDELKLARLFR